MTIKEIVNKYTSLGHNYRNAQNLAAEEIVLRKIASSPLSDHVTLKGGIVMFNLTKCDRRVTQDIDFDLIKYSIDDTSIKRFVDKLNAVKDGIFASIDGSIEPLHQEDYQGVRIHLLLKDNSTKLRIKLDIGVHTYLGIEQETLLFIFETGNKSLSLKVNPCEQMFAEKILSLARLGAISTRYKDVYDLYFLINSESLKREKVRDILNLFFLSSNREPYNMVDLYNSISDTFENKSFVNGAINPASKWLDIEFESIKKTILNYLSSL